MGYSFGKNFKITVFGESHGSSIGVVIEGLPAGLELNEDRIRLEMNRRRPGTSAVTTSRKEKDKVIIESGYFNHYTTGSALCGRIENTNKKSKDYATLKDIMRPSHSDYPGHIKYKGFQDYRGGGQFSGRLTAPIVFAGAIAKEILAQKGIYVGSHIQSIGAINDRRFSRDDLKVDVFKRLMKEHMPTLDPDKKNHMESEILKYKKENNSIGGVVEGAIINMPVGIGEPLFDSFESQLSHLMFSIPGVKGVSFGSGFNISQMSGKEANDGYYFDESGKVKTYTNHNGGVLGGLTTGMPVVLQVAFKPTPSIGVQQETINIKENSKVDLKIEGRHDPCIVTRALVVVEAACAIVALDLLLEGDASWMN